ncbi:MAG: nuclear transport factor 2 family protein [Actinomycetota bacterium]
MDTRLAALVDKSEITDVVHRYARGIDRRDWDLVRSCYHPDAHDHHGGFSGTVDEYLVWVRELTARYSMTQHLVAGVLIDLVGDVAAVETNGVAVHRSDDPAPHLNLVTGFRSLDRFERRDGRWAIAERTAVGEWAIPVESERWWTMPDHHVRGGFGPDDPLSMLLRSLPDAP